MAAMGLGELAAHTLLWTMWYVRETTDLVLLLDEPDAFFPPRSRGPLLDHLARSAVENRHAFVLTSHSREVIERALQYDDVLRYVGKTGSQVRIAQAREQVREIVHRALYPPSHLDLVGWVEDESAYALVGALFRRLDPTLVERAALYWVKGSSEVKALRDKVPRPSRHPRRLEFSFFLDGDQEAPAEDGARWPLIVLPGGTSPDALFQWALSEAPGALAVRFALDPSVVAAILESVEGLDPHDWTNDLADRSGLERGQALKALAEATLDTENGAGLVTEFTVSLKATGLVAFSGLE